ncbi:MAG: hypothetical protein HUJ87_15575 [Fusobacterium varium]|uniref:hypothetical protein n=1 Tax=Fusobacterium varium TaxID=856 RepID=UPI00242DDBEA|nr:hypothetical protein [Fusobacterium varium]MCF0171911.1 hypothetical protein [Fusobacterium varium]
MRKLLKIAIFTLLTILFISCGNSDENEVKKYLPGTYTRQVKEGEPIGFGYFKEITIKPLKGNEYRISCIGHDKEATQDVYDIEISFIELKEKSDSVQKYYIKGIVTNIVTDGKWTISSADFGVNESEIINLIIGKDIVEVLNGGNSISSIRKKVPVKKFL